MKFWGKIILFSKFSGSDEFNTLYLQMLYDASQLWSKGDVSNFSLTSSIMLYHTTLVKIQSIP